MEYGQGGTSEDSGKAIRVLAYSAMLLASALIVLAARGDLWLEEIWSLIFLGQISSPLEIVTRIKHDNNHLLSTLYLYWLGDQDNPYTYRLLSVVSGIGSLVALYYLASRQGRWEALFTVLLAGSSYPLLLYFSEARGYAPAILFSLLALIQMQRCREKFSFLNLVFFWMAITLAMLAHFTSAIVLFSLACLWAIWELGSSFSVSRKLARMAALYLVPVLFFGALYIGFIQSMTSGEADPSSYGEVFRHGGAVLLGFPDGLFSGGAALLIYALITCAETYLLFRQQDELRSFYPTVLLIAPLLMIVVMRPQFLFFRHFIVCFPFFYLLAGTLLGRLCRRRRHFIWASIAVILLMAGGHATRIVPLLQYGRGDYSSALSYISSRTQGPIIYVSSNRDLPADMVLFFYSRFLPEGKVLQYLYQWQLENNEPDWVIIQTQNPSEEPPPVIANGNIGPYYLARGYPSGGDSGWRWFIYGRERTTGWLDYH